MFLFACICICVHACMVALGFVRYWDLASPLLMLFRVYSSVQEDTTGSNKANTDSFFGTNSEGMFL